MIVCRHFGQATNLNAFKPLFCVVVFVGVCEAREHKMKIKKRQVNSWQPKNVILKKKKKVNFEKIFPKNHLNVHTGWQWEVSYSMRFLVANLNLTIFICINISFLFFFLLWRWIWTFKDYFKWNEKNKIRTKQNPQSRFNLIYDCDTDIYVPIQPYK